MGLSAPGQSKSTAPVSAWLLCLSDGSLCGCIKRAPCRRASSWRKAPQAGSARAGASAAGALAGASAAQAPSAPPDAPALLLLLLLLLMLMLLLLLEEKQDGEEDEKLLLLEDEPLTILRCGSLCGKALVGGTTRLPAARSVAA
jgi:hypothetical protein